MTGVRVTRMRLGAPDATGRQTPEEIPDADYTEPAELVIKALGFEPEELPRLWGVEGLEVTRWGTVKADFLTKRTSLDGRLCGRRHRARREPGGLGDPRRPRGGGEHPGLARRPRGAVAAE